MLRIRDLTKWVRLNGGSKLDFAAGKPRVVRLEVNAPTETRLDLIDEAGEIFFLALVKGRETVEFETSGKFSLASDADEVYVYTAEAEIVHSIVEAPESFTRIMQGRRTRNPEMEALIHQMNRNFERQLEKQARVYGDIIQRSAHPRAQVAAPASAPASVDGQPAPDGNAGPSVESPAGTPDGDKEPGPAPKGK